eukprot:7371741-Prymnesium_polylepis.3
MGALVCWTRTALTRTPHSPHPAPRTPRTPPPSALRSLPTASRVLSRALSPPLASRRPAAPTWPSYGDGHRMVIVGPRVMMALLS